MEKTKIICSECGKKNLIFISDAVLKRDRSKNVAGVLCFSCCKKINYYKPPCDSCNDFNICNGKIKDEFPKWINNIEGI